MYERIIIFAIFLFFFSFIIYVVIGIKFNYITYIFCFEDILSILKIQIRISIILILIFSRIFSYFK